MHPLGAAGKEGGIAEKYKDKGLRVIVLGSRTDKALLDKLKTFKLDCPLYSVDNNVFANNKKFFNLKAGIPQDSCIVKGKKKAGNVGKIGEASAYEPYIKAAFGF